MAPVIVPVTSACNALAGELLFRSVTLSLLKAPVSLAGIKLGMPGTGDGSSPAARTKVPSEPAGVVLWTRSIAAPGNRLMV